MGESYFHATSEGQQPKIAKWWDVDGSRARAEAVSATLSVLHQYQKQRIDTAVWNARLYGNLALASAFGVTFSELQTASASQPANRLTYNVIAECLDTIVARVAARVKPRPYWVTSGGTYKDRRRAKRLNKFSDGLMAEQRAHKLGIQCFRDAAVFGTGCAGVFLERDRLKMERVIPSELWVDEHESLHGRPRQLHRVKPVDRGTLAELFPEKRSAILKVQPANVDNVPSVTATVNELIEVRESWRLPDGPEKPGRHTISIGEATLFDEVWAHEWFPFVFIHYKPRLAGFWGKGLVEELSDIQLHINKFLWVVSRALHLHGSTKILLNKRSGVPASHLTNNPTNVLEGNWAPGEEPRWIAPPAVPVELYEQIEVQIERARQLAGVSRLTSAGQKPPGLNAAVAMREFLEVEQDRFSTLSGQYEDFFTDLVRMGIDLVADAVERGVVPDYEVKQYGLRDGQVVDWKDIDFDRDRFVLRCFPTSSLPTEPAARQQTVTEWVQAGWTDQRTAMKLLDFPDLEAVETLNQSAEDWIEHCLDSIVDDGVFIAPDPEDDLQLALKLVSQEINAAKTGTPSADDDEDGHAELTERVELLREYRDAVMALLDEQAAANAPPPAPGAPPPGAAAPQAVPVPPQQSELLPVAPAA